MASTTKPTGLLSASAASDSAETPRPTMKLVLLPVWYRTTLTSDSPAIHQNHRAADWTAGLVNATSPAVGWAGAGTSGAAESVIFIPLSVLVLSEDIGYRPSLPLEARPACRAARAAGRFTRSPSARYTAAALRFALPLTTDTAASGMPPVEVIWYLVSTVAVTL